MLRQALAGMLWSKQYYYFDLDRWLDEHGTHRPEAHGRRNRHWLHMVNDDIISMPDKWEYPWYAAWDLAFHTVALSMVDSDFAKEQLELMLSERYLHPNGQMPAYEWNFGDVNPPVHAWATLFGYRTSPKQAERGDREFLGRAFQKLLLNFTWWVNRKDPAGNNVFEGGFLGLDNIGVFDRSARLPTGGRLEQADGTAWMAFFCQNMLEMALELGRDDPSYEEMVVKFVEHFLWIAASMDCVGDTWTRCGTRRTASSTTSCACPTGTPRASRCARWWACCPCARRRSSPAATPSASRRRWSASGRSWPSGPS